jgi:lysophospholipase L1-like esterase
MMKSRGKVIIRAAVVLAALIVGFFVFAGTFVCWGPFKPLSALRVSFRYRDRPEGSTVFYGASNFDYWKTLEQDMAPYPVRNLGFGGSTDRDLMRYADFLLYPYKPNIVFFQTGSNDFIYGLDAGEIIANKGTMYSMFRAALPGAVFVVMSGLPLPGRSPHWEATQEVNRYLASYCADHENMIFLDATDLMTNSAGAFRPEIFVKDGIHLNEAGRKIWGALIFETLKKLVDRP